MTTAQDQTSLTSNTKFTLDLPTIAMCVGLIATLVTGFNVIKTDIAEASKRADNSLTKIEFTISQEAVKQIVVETQYHIRDGHTTMFHQLVAKQDTTIDDAVDKIVEEIRRSKK